MEPFTKEEILANAVAALKDAAEKFKADPDVICREGNPSLDDEPGRVENVRFEDDELKFTLRITNPLLIREYLKNMQEDV